jgi:hypothetical protein
VLANWKLGIVLEKTYAAGVQAGSQAGSQAGVQKGTVDPKITEAFGPLILELIAKSAELARSLPTRSR